MLISSYAGTIDDSSILLVFLIPPGCQLNHKLLRAPGSASNVIIFDFWELLFEFAFYFFRVPPASAPAPEPSIESQPPMMSLKAFINTLDDNVSDDEALKKYNEYKMEFRRQQLNEFFVAHKDEEW